MKKLNIFLVVGLFFLGLSIRSIDLNCDPPAFFAEGGQALTTDAAHLTLHAKNKVLFGQWDLFGHQHWTAFKVSLVSALSWLLYSLLGVSRVVTNLTGVLLNLAGLALFLIALREYLSDRGMVYCTLFLMCNFAMTIYARLPFAENGLIFIAGLIFVVYTYWFDTLAGKILLGVLVALCGLVGKAFGFLVAAGPLGYMLLRQSRRERMSSLVVTAGAALATVVVFSYFFLGDGGLTAFLWEHAAGGHGFPGGLRSVGGLFEHLIAVTTYSSLHLSAPVTSLLVYLFFLGTILRGKLDLDNPRGMLFLIFWLLACLAIMSPFNYLPLRYQYVLIIPLAAIAGYALDNLKDLLPDRKVRTTIWKAILLLPLNWYLVYYGILYTVVSSDIMSELYRYVWYALPGGVIITALQLFFFSRRELKISSRPAVFATVILIGLFCILTGKRYVEYATGRTYNIIETNRDVVGILGPDAVLSGQYGPALAADTHLRSLPFFLGRSMGDAVRMFGAYPVTHIAVSASEWRKWCEKYPHLLEAPLVARYWLRDNIVYLVRTAAVFGNEAAAGYQLSEYERAVDCIYAGRPDSGFVHLNRSLSAHSRCKSALLELYYLIAEHGQLEQAEPIVQQLVGDFPTDFSVHMVAAVFYKSLAQLPGFEKQADLSQYHLETAIKYNPFNEAVLRRMHARYPPNKRIVT